VDRTFQGVPASPGIVVGPVYLLRWDDEIATATVAGCAQVFDLHALKAFAADKRVRKMLFKTDQLWSEIACYEPGQSTVMHQHPKEEEAIFVLEGTANMNIDGQEVVVGSSRRDFPSMDPRNLLEVLAEMAAAVVASLGQPLHEGKHACRSIAYQKPVDELLLAGWKGDV